MTAANLASVLALISLLVASIVVRMNPHFHEVVAMRSQEYCFLSGIGKLSGQKFYDTIRRVADTSVWRRIASRPGRTDVRRKQGSLSCSNAKPKNLTPIAWSAAHRAHRR